MKIQKIISRNKRLSIIIVVALVVAVCTLVYSNVKNDDYVENGYYTCIYSGTSGGARCLQTGGEPEADYGGCYGYYSLLGNDIKDGIKVDGDSASTCEGLSADEVYIFDQAGKYLGKRSYSM